MKSTQLLSVVLSLIMFTGVTTGSAVFAQSDDYYDELEDIIEDFCEMTDEEQSDAISDYSELSEYEQRLSEICAIDDIDERYDTLEDITDEIIPETRNDVDDDFDETDDDVIEDFEDCVEAGYPVMESYPEQCMTDDGTIFVNNEYDDDRDKDKDHDLDDRLERFCEMTDEDKRQLFTDHPRLEQFSDRLASYCDLPNEERENNIDRFIHEHMAIIKEHMDKMYMDYDRFCAMTDSDLAAATFDRDFVDRASKWCDMTPDERDEYMMKHHDDIKDKVTDKMHDKLSDMPFDRMSDVAKDRMSDVAKDKLHDKMMKLDDSHRLKAMIKSKYDVSDDRIDEIKMKYREKYGNKSDKMIMEIKMKYKDHMSKMQFQMTDERKAEIHDRLAEMKAFKDELREKSSDLTDEEKQQLREDFIEKAKDLQLAWITPHTQMVAGIDATDVECREGFSLVMKASNGVAMCLKADTALKMIDRGIVVPAN